MPTHREQVLKKLGLPKATSLSLEELAEKTDLPIEALQEVYNRGIGAHSTSPLSVRMKGSFKKGVNAPMSMKLSKEQWAFARVYAWVNKSKVFYNQDADIARKYRIG
jgi:hypothetical protein